MGLAAIILAAGGSTRFGKPKQLALFRGTSLVRLAVRAAGEAGCEPILAVVGAQAKEIETELGETAARLIENPAWKEGLGASIRAGIAQLSEEEIDAVVLLACDQPLVTAAVIESLRDLATSSGKSIVASSYSGTIGIPALFRRSCFADLQMLKDDRGAKNLITSQPDNIAALEFPEGAIDIDTPEDLARFS